MLAATILFAGCGRDPDLEADRVMVRTVAADPAPRELAAPARERAIAHWSAVHTWNAVAAWTFHQSIRMAVAVRRNETARARRFHSAPAIESEGSGLCGGDLPPCSVMICESRGDLRAENPSSSASGKWQILDRTWAGFGGYARAADAPESVQDAKAKLIYAGGSGRSQWSC